MLNILMTTALGALAFSAQDITASTGVKADAELVAQEFEAAPDATEGPTDLNLPEAEVAVIAEGDVETIAETSFRAADINGDMTLTEEEFVSAALAEQGIVEDAATEEMLLEDMEDPADDETTDMAEAETSTADEPVKPATYLREKFAAMSRGDGELTSPEYETALKDDFAAADQDGDDVLTGAEIDTFAALRKGEKSAI